MKKRRKNIKNWLKENKKIIFTVLILLVTISVVSSFSSNSVFAKLTGEEELLRGETGFIGNIVGTIEDLITNGLNKATGVLMAPFSTFITIIGVFVFFVLYIIFQSMGMANGLLSFPFPDSIVFNRMAFFDPNFINPTQVGGKNAPVYILQGTISSLYYTFFILALTIFVIAAMIIGIKLAISSIASEKAQYKQALTNWVFGIILLFTVHILMAGIFAINEGITAVAYEIAGKIEFKLPVVQAIPLVGNSLNNIIGGSSDGGIDFIGILTGGLSNTVRNAGVKIDAPEFTGTGYMGLTLIFLAKGLGGDLISALILFIIMGQTVALVIMYIKRLFYCIFLGMLAPLIVAVDVIKKSMV